MKMRFGARIAPTVIGSKRLATEEVTPIDDTMVRLATCKKIRELFLAGFDRDVDGEFVARHRHVLADAEVGSSEG
jgi:hypothetical protein